MFKKYNKIQSLRTYRPVGYEPTPFKKYNKIQSLRTETATGARPSKFKKYNKIQSLRTVGTAIGTAIRSKNTTKYNP